MLKVALTAWLAFIVSVQPVLVPLHAPDQLTKYAPLPAAAVSFTTVPAANDALQVGEQVIPAGLLLTVPVEVPARLTVN